MRRYIVAGLVLLFLAPVLGGCASGSIQKFETQVVNVAGAISGAKVKGKTAYLAIQTFNASERLVTGYLRLPLCGPNVPRVCRALGAAEAIDQPFNAGIVARNELRGYMRANPGTLADAGLYTNLTSATTALKNIMAVYGIGGG